MTTTTPSSPAPDTPPSAAPSDIPPPEKPPGPPSRAFRWWLLALVVAIAAVAAYFYYKPDTTTTVGGAPQQAGGGQGKGARGGGQGAGKGQGAQGNRPLPVVAEDAKSGDMEVYLDALGSVTALNSVTVHSRVDGQLMRVAFSEGQRVRAGDVLAEIDPRPFQVQLTQAEGQMAKDQALLKNARLDVERYAQLFQQDSIARQQLDTQRALVSQYEGTVKADQGAIDNAKLQLVYARVTAPISGRLGLRQVDAGNVVHAGDANGIVVITQVQPISVVFTLPEDSLTQVLKRMREGTKVPVEAWDRAQKVKLADGVLQSIDNQIDATTGTVKLKAQFPNQDESLFPNQFVNIRMLIDTLHGAILIPTAAIQRGNAGTFVYVVKEDSSVTVRPVVLGPAKGEITSISKGLQAGEKVVVDGADKLREGGKVELISRDAQTAPGPGGGRRGGQRKGGGQGSDQPAARTGAAAAGQTGASGEVKGGPDNARPGADNAKRGEGRRGAGGGGPPQ